MPLDWDEIREPLIRKFTIPTNKGLRTFTMNEPTEEDLKPVFVAYPYPPKPTKMDMREVTKAGGGIDYKEFEIPDEDPEILKEWQTEYKRIDELRWLGFVVASLPAADRPPGETVEEKIEYLSKFPPVLKQRLVKEAMLLSNTRLAERFEEAKKD